MSGSAGGACPYCTGSGLDPLPPTRGPRQRATQLPPFGSEALALLKYGSPYLLRATDAFGDEATGDLAISSRVWIFVAGSPRPHLDAWRLAARHRERHGEGFAMVLPADVDPRTYRWPPFHAVTVYCPDISDDRVREVAEALIACAVQEVQTFGESRAPVTFKAS